LDCCGKGIGLIVIWLDVRSINTYPIEDLWYRLMVEMVVFIIGIYTLLFGQLKLPWNLTLKNWRARIAAVFLIAPLPLSILLGREVGQGLSVEKAQSIFGLTELLLVVLGVGGAILFAYLTRSRDVKSHTDESL